MYLDSVDPDQPMENTGRSDSIKSECSQTNPQSLQARQLQLVTSRRSRSGCDTCKYVHQNTSPVLQVTPPVAPLTML